MALNLFQLSVVFHVETSRFAQMTGFCMERNTGLKRVNQR